MPLHGWRWECCEIASGGGAGISLLERKLFRGEDEAQMFPRQKKVPAALTHLEKSSILLITPFAEDDLAVRQIMKDAGTPVRTCGTVKQALEEISISTATVVLCEAEITDGSWKAVLTACDALPDPPLVLVVSKHADERLWAEVLNLGGFDVLLKPFDTTEVSRVLGMACQHKRPCQAQAAPELPEAGSTLLSQYA